jgi:hypothetical protein
MTAVGDSIPDKMIFRRKTMKKGLILVLAILTVFAFVSCDSDSGTKEEEKEGPKTVPLGDFDWVNNDNQKGWRSNGTDSTETDLAYEDVVAAKYLVLELNAAPAGGFQIVWQGNGTPGWGWNQQDILAGDGTPIDGNGGTITESGGKVIFKIEFSAAFAEKDYAGFLASTQVKILIAYYTGGIAGLGIQKAYLEMAE